MTMMRQLLPLLSWFLLALPTAALAQFVAPSISLSSTELAPGETLRFDARQLVPNSDYIVRLEGPNGLRVGGTVTSDANGALRYETQLAALGAWTLRFDGTNVSVLLGLEVVEGVVTAPAPSRQGVPPSRSDTVPEQWEDTAGPDAPPADQSPGAEQVETAPQGQGAAAEPEQPPAPPSVATEQEPVAADPGILVDPGVEFTVGGQELVARVRDGEALWRLAFPPDSGPLSAQALLHEGALYLGKGAGLLEIDPLTGRVLARYRIPAAVARLEVGSEGLAGWTLGSDVQRPEGSGDLEDGLPFVLENGVPRWRDDALETRSPLASSPYPAEIEPFGWLRREAEVPDPAARLERDPTNPFLHLRFGRDLDSEGGRLEAFGDALTQAATFFESAQLAQELFEAGATELAEQAMAAALADFAARGYDPRLLTDLGLHRAYGFPLPRFEAALARGGLAEARFWAPWVYALAADSVPASEEALREYARQLRSAGDRDAATQWRARSNLPGPGGLATLLDRQFQALGRVGWYAVASLLIAILALHLTLIAKYWRPQAVLGRERRGGRAPSPAAHLLAMRFYSLTEKIVLVLLFAASIALAGLAIWQDESGPDTPALGRGTLRDLAPDIVASERLQDPANPLGRYLVGFVAQSQGETERAAAAYRQAGDFAPALNNLGALTGDDTLFERALEVDPRQLEARFNAGRIDDPSPFHALVRSGEPLLAVPTHDDVRSVLVGDWRDAVAQTFTDPWSTFSEARAPGLQAAWLWWTVLTLFSLAAVATLLWLAVPRPRLARNAPRTIAYQILALLLPGSGLTDELWGLLLLTPWAIFGLDALANYSGWGFGLGVGFVADLVVLGGLYLVNTVAFIVELGSYNRRMRDLKRRDPETALRFGMRVRESPNG